MVWATNKLVNKAVPWYSTFCSSKEREKKASKMPGNGKINTVKHIDTLTLSNSQLTYLLHFEKKIQNTEKKITNVFTATLNVVYGCGWGGSDVL